MKIDFELNPPNMPNFITYGKPKVGKRQDGFQVNTQSIHVSNLSEDEAIAYGELMKQTFIEHWRKTKFEPNS